MYTSSENRFCPIHPDRGQEMKVTSDGKADDETSRRQRIATHDMEESRHIGHETREAHGETEEDQPRQPDIPVDQSATQQSPCSGGPAGRAPDPSIRGGWLLWRPGAVS